MIHIRFFWVFLFFNVCGFLQAQILKSEQSTIYIDNIEIPDTKPPLIKIISPDVSNQDLILSDSPEITLIGKITDEESGINRIIINSKMQKVTEDGFILKDIPLQKGKNKIRVIAIDNKDNYSEQSFIVDYQIKNEINTSKLDVKGTYYGLLICIDEYDDPNLPDLSNPVRDAEKLYDVLVKDYMFEKENIMLIKNPKRAEIINGLDYMAKTLTSEDNLLIFYAGHGWWDEESNNGYWLPSDAKKSGKAEWFRNSALCDYLKEIKSKHTLLITDACFGGAIFKTRSVSMEAPKAIKMLYDLPSRKAMTSGTLTEVPDRSSFVKYLIERLANCETQYLSSEQLFSSFRIAVINNSDVVPQYGEIKNVGDQGGDFIFIKRD